MKELTQVVSDSVAQATTGKAIERAELEVPAIPSFLFILVLDQELVEDPLVNPRLLREQGGGLHTKETRLIKEILFSSIFTMLGHEESVNHLRRGEVRRIEILENTRRHYRGEVEGPKTPQGRADPERWVGVM